MHLPLSFSICKIYVDAIFNTNMRQNVITPCPGILPDCDQLAEKLALLHFSRPLSNHATVCSGGAGGGDQRMSLQQCANLSDCTERLAHARHGSFQPELLLSMLSSENLYEIEALFSCWNIFRYSDRTLLSSMRSVYDVLPLWLPSVCWHGKWLGNQETPHCIKWFDAPTGQRGIWKKILYIWFSNCKPEFIS